jgi:hypothetical protein
MPPNSAMNPEKSYSLPSLINSRCCAKCEGKFYFNVCNNAQCTSPPAGNSGNLFNEEIWYICGWTKGAGGLGEITKKQRTNREWKYIRRKFYVGWWEMWILLGSKKSWNLRVITLSPPPRPPSSVFNHQHQQQQEDHLNLRAQTESIKVVSPPPPFPVVRF